MPLYDYLYADLPKVASFHSQIVTTAAGLPPVNIANPGNYRLFRELETGLAEQGYLLDLSGDQAGRSLRNALLRKRLSSALCIKVTGRAVIEDYPRIRRVVNAFHFARGASPSLPLTMLGIVTSAPPDGDDTFNPMAEFDREGLTNAESVENSMRGVFQRFDAVDKLIRTCRFPRIMVQPLLVYRSV